MYPLVTCSYYKLLKDTNDSYKTGNTEIQKRKQTKQKYLQMLYDLDQSKWKKVLQQMNWMSDAAVN